MHRGSRPAAVLQYGSIDGTITADDYNSNDSSTSDLSSPSALAIALEEGLIPIDPQTGFQSTKHIDCITSAHKHGFLPLNSVGEPYQNSTVDNSSLFYACKF